MKLNDRTIVRLLSKKKNTSQILDELKGMGISISGRTWREIVKNYNREFDSRDRYIASDNQGYFLTTKEKWIAISNYRKIKVALSMLKSARNDLKELADKNQLSLFDDDLNIFDAILKLGI